MINPGHALEIEQEIFDEKDEDIGCRNYPTEQFSNYFNCDQAFIQTWMANHMPNFSPIWTSKSINDTTTLKENVNLTEGYGSFIYGADATWTASVDCPQPCKATRVGVRY